MPVALKQGNGCNDRPVPRVLANFCISIALPKFKKGCIAFLFLPFSVVNEKVLRDTFPFSFCNQWNFCLYQDKQKYQNTYATLCYFY